MKRKLLPLLMALPLALAACGGGNDEPVAADPLDAVPASASESAAGMTGYLRALTVAPSETREPLSVGSFNPPRPEDAEPDPKV